MIVGIGGLFSRTAHLVQSIRRFHFAAVRPPHQLRLIDLQLLYESTQRNRR